jgi:hypothetical protein
MVAWENVFEMAALPDPPAADAQVRAFLSDDPLYEQT